MTQQTKKLGVFQRILLFASALVLLILVGFQAIPLSYGSTVQYINQASLQLARSNGFAKNALILQYGTSNQQTQALSDTQVVLPLFVNEQNTLLKNNQQDIQVLLQQALPDYLALTAAVNTIVNHTELTINPMQVVIIEESSRNYNVVMNQYVLILQNQANDFTLHLVIIQEIMGLLIAACFIWLRSLGIKQLKSALIREEGK